MRSIHKLVLWGSCLVLVIVLISITGWATWLGYLGEVPKEFVKGLLEPLFPYFPSIEKIQSLAGILGALGTAAGTSWGIYKSLRFAETALPERLNEALAKIHSMVVTDAQALPIAVEDDKYRDRIRIDGFFDPRYAEALKSFKSGEMSRANKLFREAETALASDEKVIEGKLRLVSQQRVSALLARSAIELAAYSELPLTERDEAALQLRALVAKLEKISGNEPSQLTALQIRGDIHRALNSVELARGAYEQLANHSQAQNVPLLQARAYSRLARMDWEQATQAGLLEACKKFTKAEQILGNPNLLNDEHLRELSEISLLHSQVRAARNQCPLWKHTHVPPYGALRALRSSA